MASTTRIKCIMLLVAVALPGDSFAELKGDPQLPTNRLEIQDETEINTQTGEKIDLQSIFGANWESENKPLDKEKFDMVLKHIFELNTETGLESNTQTHLRPNHENIEAIFGPQQQLENEQFAEVDIDQDSKVAEKNNQKTNKSGHDNHQYFDSQTVDPFKSFNSDWFNIQSGVVLSSSSYRPDTQAKSSPRPFISSFKPKTPPAVFHPIEQGEEDGTESNPNLTVIEKSTMKPTSPSNKQDEIPPHNPSFMQENQSEGGIIPNIFNSSNPNNTSPRPETPVTPSFWHIGKPNNEDIVNQIRTGHHHPHRYHHPHHSMYHNFWPGPPRYYGPTNLNFRHGYQNGAHLNNFNFRPRGYHYHHWMGRRDFQRGFETTQPGNVEVEPEQNIDPRFAFNHQKGFQHNHGEWGRRGHHAHRYHHHHHPGMHHSHGSPISYR